MLKVLLIIPAHNEAENLPRVLEELREYRDRLNIVVIDDASTDATAQVAKSYGVPVVQLAVNAGVGGAVQTGFKYAVRHGFDVAIQLDGDGQHDPAWIDKLLAPIVAGQADCVIGSRYVKGHADPFYKTPLVRRIGMWFSTAILFLATRQLITDTTSGFRALNHAILTYFAHDYPADHPEAEALFVLYRLHFRIQEVPIQCRGRYAGQSLFAFSRSVLYPFRVMVGFLGVILREPRR
jgi:glycosyltransferase involved in cell wall biosynthesis